MAIAGKIVKEFIENEINKNIKKLDHDVDCIVKDLRAGKGGGLNIKKTTEFIVKAKKAVEIIDNNMDTIKKIRKSLKAARKTAEAGRKANVVASALNPLTAALGYAAEFVVKQLENEEKGLRNVTKVVPSITANYKNFLSRATATIAAALVAKALKEKVKKDRTNMVG